MADTLLRPLWRSQDGRVIHLNGCPYSAGSLRWNYADSLDDFGVWVAMDKYHWLRWCGHCRNRHPEVLADSEHKRVLDRSDKVTQDIGIGVHRDPFTDEIVASDTFEVPAQGKFYIAGEEVSERAYRRHESVCQETRGTDSNPGSGGV